MAASSRSTRPRHAALSDPGRVRGENQDAWHADPAAGLYLVADGMGGLAAGGVASKAVAELLPPALKARLAAARGGKAAKAALAEGLAEFSAGLRQRSLSEGGLKGMGSTVVLALVRGRALFVAHLGDSRAYLYRRGRLERLTKDHSIVAVMLAMGRLTPEEAEAHPLRHALSRFVGMEGRAAAEVCQVRLEGRARLLLCSDGLTNMVPDQGLAAALAEAPDAEAAAKRLVAEANAAGGADNVTALVADLG